MNECYFSGHVYCRLERYPWLFTYQLFSTKLPSSLGPHKDVSTFHPPPASLCVHSPFVLFLFSLPSRYTLTSQGRSGDSIILAVSAATLPVRRQVDKHTMCDEICSLLAFFMFKVTGNIFAPPALSSILIAFIQLKGLRFQICFHLTRENTNT